VFRYYFAKCSAWYRVLDTKVLHGIMNVTEARVGFYRMPGLFHSSSQCLCFDHVTACPALSFLQGTGCSLRVAAQGSNELLIY